MFDQDPNEQANISGADFAMMVDEMNQLRQQLAAAQQEIERFRKHADENRYSLSLGHGEFDYELHGTKEQVDYFANVLLQKDKDLSASQALMAKYREALSGCLEDLQDWAGYASEYFQQKHDLKGDIAKYTQALATPSDNSALREFGLRVAKLTKEEAVSYDCIEWDKTDEEIVDGVLHDTR